MGKTKKELIFHSFGFKGSVSVAATDTLQDVRRRILDEVDDHLIPKGDWRFSVDDIHVGVKQEEKKMAWEDILDQNKKVVLVQITFPLKRKSVPEAPIACKKEVRTGSDSGNKSSRKRNRFKNPRQHPPVVDIIDMTGEDEDEDSRDSTHEHVVSGIGVISPDDEPSDKSIATRLKARLGSASAKGITSMPITPERELSDPGAVVCKTEDSSESDKTSRKRRRSKNPGQRPSAPDIIDLTDEDKNKGITDSTKGRSTRSADAISPDDVPSDRSNATRLKTRKKKSRPDIVVSREEPGDRGSASGAERNQNTPRRITRSTRIIQEREVNNPDVAGTAEGKQSTTSSTANDRVQTEVAPDMLPTGDDAAVNVAVPIKEETRKKFAAERQKCYAKYGEKFLLHRQLERGIRRLGGNMQNTWVFPRENHPATQEHDYPVPLHIIDREGPIDRRDYGYLAFNTTWQPNGPMFAGQETASVGTIPDYFKATGDPFPVFMKRTLTDLYREEEGRLIGWEYVGNYKYVPLDPDDDDAIFYESANNFSRASKHEIARKTYKSYRNEQGYGRKRVDEWRNRLVEAIGQDNEPHLPHSLAARCLSLGFEPNMSSEKLCYLLVDLDEYHQQDLIKFVYYDDRIYNYCSGGKTNCTKNGDTISGRNGAGEPAKAQDWYDFATVNMLFKY